MDPLISKAPIHTPAQRPTERKKISQNVKSFSEVMENRKLDHGASQIQTNTGAGSGTLSRDALLRTSTSLEQTIERLRNGQSRLDNLLERLQDGHPVGEPEMILIQGMLLATSRDIELISKMVEQLVSGIKTTMQTQV